MSAAIDLKLFDIQAATPMDRVPAGVLHLDCETLTVAELIRRRVEQEVAQFNADTQAAYPALVQLTEAEQRLNQSVPEPKDLRPADVETQVTKALQAFQKNGFFVLVDEHQVESLDEELQLSQITEVSFFKLVPLVGG